MTRAAATDSRYSFVAFTPVSGISTCNSSRKTFDFSATEAFQSFAATQEPHIGVNPASAVTGGSVLASVHPVLDDEGRFLGLTSVSVPHALIRSGDPAAEPLPFSPREKLELFAIDRDGAVLTYSGDLEDAAAMLPLDVAQRIADSSGPTVLTVTARDLRTRTYAVVPLIDTELYLVGSWQGDMMAGLTSLSRAGFVVPFLMLVVSVIGAMAAGHFLVSRYVRELSSEMQSFAAGSRRLRADRNDGAPAEIRALTVAFDDMTARLMHDEAELENTIHQRDVLLREVHHRVKNNLQLIASMMNLQIRHAASNEAKLMLRELQDRVMSLASIHRELYVTSGAADVRADELLTDICKRIVNLGTGVGRHIRTSFDFEDVHLSPDQAVPLSLIVTEALTNALKYAGAADGQPADIAVSLRREGGSRLVAEVTNSLDPIVTDADSFGVGDAGQRKPGSIGLGLRLIQAFTQQIGGDLTTESDGERHVLRVSFPVGDATVAEVAAQDATDPDA
jgi:two-component sensor histidine kinase